MLLQTVGLGQQGAGGFDGGKVRVLPRPCRLSKCLAAPRLLHKRPTSGAPPQQPLRAKPHHDQCYVSRLCAAMNRCRVVFYSTS